MNLVRNLVLRHAVSALLMMVLMLAGIGRGMAAGSDVDFLVQPNSSFGLPICHAGGAAAQPDQRKTPVHHDCCDECALCAPVAVSAVADLPAPALVSHVLVRSALITWTARLSRARSPRQAQGPPAA